MQFSPIAKDLLRAITTGKKFTGFWEYETKKPAAKVNSVFENKRNSSLISLKEDLSSKKRTVTKEAEQPKKIKKSFVDWIGDTLEKQDKAARLSKKKVTLY